MNFLYTYSLPKRPNLAKLMEAGIIGEAPRGFEPLTPEGFRKLLEILYLYRDTLLRKNDLLMVMQWDGWTTSRFNLAWY